MTSEQTPAAPPPAATFDLLPLSAEVRRAVEEMGYTAPTPVQLAVWEPATRGQDAVVQARTGTGKTASFGLPIIDRLVRRGEPGVQALVLCPTRELAVQVSQELVKLAQYRETSILAIYGGASMERQIQALNEGVQVVVGTPGRVLDHIRRGTLSTAKMRLLVLDEADEMLSMGFERELTAILESLPASRQTLLFSATVPGDIERIAKTKLKQPEFVTLSGDHVGALSIQHFTYLVPSDKKGSLIRIIETENPDSAVVFCNTKDETEAVAAALVARGFDAEWLNGDLAQGDRERVMTKTKQGKLRFLVATDVAARGIDISHLTHVINYDFPFDAETYVHRTGRTGRAGRTGTAISLIMPQDIGALYLLRLTYKIRPVERTIPSASELRTRAEADLLGMLAEALLSKGQHDEDRALARRLLSHDQAEGILAGLLREYLGARPSARDDAAEARRQPKRAAFKARDTGRSQPESAPLDRGAAQASERGTSQAIGDVRVSDSQADARVSPQASETSNEPSGGRPRSDRDPRDGRERGGRDGRERFDRDARSNSDRRDARSPRDADFGRGGRGERAPSAPRDIAERTTDNPTRASNFVAWAPPVEPGDDEPVLTANGPAAASSAAAADASTAVGLPKGDADFAELFVGVGRRDGVRAQDLLKALVDAGIEKENIQRVRVRDRHAFVAVAQGSADALIAKLNGTEISGKPAVTVELAKERATLPAEG